LKRELFTTVEIGTALGVDERTVRKALRDTPKTGVKRARGQIAKAWAIGSLPAAIIGQLRETKERLGYRTEADVLRKPLTRWQPAIPLRDIAAQDIAAAEALQRVLARALSLPQSASMSERVRVALNDYRRELGSVSDRHLRRLIERTLERDRGERCFERIELYLSESPRAAVPIKAATSAITIFPELDRAFAAIENRANPSSKDANYCWRKVVECYTDRVDSDADADELKRALREYLWNAITLAPTRGALKRTFNRKLQKHSEGGLTELLDGRWTDEREKPLPPDWKENVELCAVFARRYDGRISQAFRELYDGTNRDGERFTEPFREFYKFDVRKRKSAVPNAFRAAVRAMMKATDALSHGPKTARLAQPSIHRDWSMLDAGASYTSDDMTPNHYFYDWCEDGEFECGGRRFNVTRGQWLPMLDERTDNPLGFWLAPRASYNARDIRALITTVCLREEIGLPFQRFVFEQGTWKSKLVSQVTASEWQKLDEAFARYGLNLRIHHATTPKAKTIERAFSVIQNMMDDLPGYVGRNERSDVYERVQRSLQRLKRVGQPLKAEYDPSDFLLSKDEFASEIEKVLWRFANEPQNGKRLDGLSPAEGWATLHGDRPHIVLPDSLRYLIETETSTQTVTVEGVKLRINGEFVYYHGHERLGSLVGEKVRVRYNPFLPEQVLVCHLRADPRELAPFAVPMSARVPAIGATREQMREARSQAKRFLDFGRSTYRILVPKRNLTVRNEQLGSAESRARGEVIIEHQREVIELRGRRAAKKRVINELASRAGVNIDVSETNDPEGTASKLERLAALHSKYQKAETLSPQSDE
jgi:hypothetical protein